MIYGYDSIPARAARIIMGADDCESIGCYHCGYVPVAVGICEHHVVQAAQELTAMVADDRKRIQSGA